MSRRARERARMAALKQQPVPQTSQVQEMSVEEFRRHYRPNWQRQCGNCLSKPVVPVSGLCGPCHFGRADTINGDWWDYKTEDFRADL